MRTLSPAEDLLPSPLFTGEPRRNEIAIALSASAPTIAEPSRRLEA
jgi:hypothetical protein